MFWPGWMLWGNPRQQQIQSKNLSSVAEYSFITSVISKNLFSLLMFYFVRVSILQAVVVNVKNIYIEAIPVYAFTVLNFTKSNAWIFNISKCFYKACSHSEGKIQLPLAHSEAELPFKTAILGKQCCGGWSKGIVMHNVRAISFCL